VITSRQQRLAHWGETRQKGKRRFILVNGALAWGVSTALVWTMVMWLIAPEFEPLPNLLLALVMFPMGGMVWGWIVWASTEKEYLRRTGVDHR